MVKDLGMRLRNIRKQKGITLKELAYKTGLSIGFISNVERDLCSPTLDNIQRLCAALDITLVSLLENRVFVDRIIRKKDREIIYEYGKDVRYESVRFGSGLLDGLFITVDANCQYEKEWTHAYDEIGIVVSGELTIAIDDSKYILYEGDCFYVHAMERHNLSNNSDSPCVSYWVKQLTDKHR